MSKLNLQEYLLTMCEFFIFLRIYSHEYIVLIPHGKMHEYRVDMHFIGFS